MVVPAQTGQTVGMGQKRACEAPIAAMAIVRVHGNM
jgi:hypothetical protein